MYEIKVSMWTLGIYLVEIVMENPAIPALIYYDHGHFHTFQYFFSKQSNHIYNSTSLVIPLFFSVASYQVWFSSSLMLSSGSYRLSLVIQQKF